MTFKERMAIVEKVVDVERILFGVQLPASGSLYFKDFLGADEKSVDIPNGAGVISRAKFCVGPSSEYLWWYQNRHMLAVNHEPCKYLDPRCFTLSD